MFTGDGIAYDVYSSRGLAFRSPKMSGYFDEPGMPFKLTLYSFSSFLIDALSSGVSLVHGLSALRSTLGTS